MSAALIDGKAIAQEMRGQYAAQVAALRARGVVPALAVIIVGDHAASKVYVRNKSLACQQVGMHSSVHELSPSTTQAELIAFLHDLNANPSVHGILVQLPLPPHIDGRTVIEAIDPNKDVDGFHYHNV